MSVEGDWLCSQNILILLLLLMKPRDVVKNQHSVVLQIRVVRWQSSQPRHWSRGWWGRHLPWRSRSRTSKGRRVKRGHRHEIGRQRRVCHVSQICVYIEIGPSIGGHRCHHVIRAGSRQRYLVCLRNLSPDERLLLSIQLK